MDFWREVLKNLSWDESNYLANKICQVIYLDIAIIVISLISGYIYYGLMIILCIKALILLGLLLFYPLYNLHETLKVKIVFMLADIQEKLRKHDRAP